MSDWPRLPPEPIDGTVVGWWITPEDKPTPPSLCKHEREECETCGTTVRRDAAHETRGGRGKVGRLKRG